jgi:hypothetical protein
MVLAAVERGVKKATLLHIQICEQEKKKGVAIFPCIFCFAVAAVQMSPKRFMQYAYC